MGIHKPLQLRGYYAAAIHARLYGECDRYHGYCLDDVTESSSYQDKVYAGFGGYINLSYIAASKARYALLMDINPLQSLFWNEIFETLKRAKTSAEFKDEAPNLYDRILQKVRASGYEGVNVAYPLIRASSYPNEIRDAESQIQSAFIFTSGRKTRSDLLWLEREELYQHLRTLALQDSLSTHQIDLFAENEWNELADFLGDSFHVSLLYLSNILNFLEVSETDFLGRKMDKTASERAKSNIRKILAPEYSLITCENLRSGRPLLSSHPEAPPKEF